jgi:hypothetical protein
MVSNHVHGLPVMTHISQEGVLSLVGYKMNSGVSIALGEFLGGNVQDNSPFLVHDLCLDDCNLSDFDFASILKGLLKQNRLEHLSYA